ncbi:GNAT family N-acetyltransferase [Acidaminobacter sp. JC074]|uniref:GNAT family N-acetyltransferase n=1 Tax=Acidaminobacter sp. JC074 TaxID=2530199 RepID=UPI001F0FF2FC|nr:GNAT family N-acetyltransferase [Acidaminobacter sp. JC074]MCH4886217.1 GNAT family N-acetyltransferase [Acidaminobacter sp. JC074]
MIEVNNLSKYKNDFNVFTHNVPVIYAHFEGQYQGHLYVDDETDPQVMVLFTPFDFHYLTGNPQAENVLDKVDEIIFTYLKNNQKKEAILFAPTLEWQNVLDQVFKRHKGILDKRFIFELDKEVFEKRLEDNKVEIVFESENGSTIEYPVARIYQEGKSVSFCAGFMLGKGHAEINVETLENFRGKGYGKMASMALIKYLLDQDIQPDWCTWPYRIASQTLAESLGFVLKEEVPAYIWVEEVCGKL